MNNDVVILNLDRPRVLKFGHMALKTLEGLTEKTVRELDEGFDVLDLDFVEKAAYCGLLSDAEKNTEIITLEQMPKLLDHAQTQAHVFEKLLAAWRVTFGAPSEIPEGNLPEPVDQPENETTTGKKANE